MILLEEQLMPLQQSKSTKV